MGDRELLYHYVGVIDDLLNDFSYVTLPGYDQQDFLKQLNYHESPQEMTTLLRAHREELERCERSTISPEALRDISKILLISDEINRRVSAVTPQHVVAMKAIGDLQALIILVFMESEISEIIQLPAGLTQQSLAHMREYLMSSVRLGISDTSEVRKNLHYWCPELLSLSESNSTVRELVEKVVSASEALEVDEMFSDLI